MHYHINQRIGTLGTNEWGQPNPVYTDRHLACADNYLDEIERVFTALGWHVTLHEAGRRDRTLEISGELFRSRFHLWMCDCSDGEFELHSEQAKRMAACN